MPFEVEYEGEVDCEEVQIKEDGTVYLASCTANGTEVDYTYGKKSIYSNGEVVYFNVTTGNGCTVNDYTDAQSATGVKTGCMKFYAFNDDGENTVNLLLDHNTTAMVAWNSSNINTTGPTQVITALAIDTGSWSGTETPTNYTIN